MTVSKFVYSKINKKSNRIELKKQQKQQQKVTNYKKDQNIPPAERKYESKYLYKATNE